MTGLPNAGMLPWPRVTTYEDATKPAFLLQGLSTSAVLPIESNRMEQWPATRLTLLDRMRDATNQEAWRDFLALYQPLVHRFVRRRVRQEADADDVIQEVLSAVAKGTFDPTKGRFHKWLLTVTLNKLRDFGDRNRRGVFETLPDIAQQPSSIEDEWEREHKQQLFDRAAEIVRADAKPEHWQAFWLTAVENRSGQEVASILGMTLANVFSAKSRIKERIRELVQSFEEM